MRKQITLLILLQMVMLITGVVYSQTCPETLTATISSVTPATCPSNGSVVITTNAPEDAMLIFYLLSGPDGAPLMEPQNSGTYNSLLAGHYQAVVVCDLDGDITDTISFDITDLNVELEDMSLSYTSLCADLSTTSTIHVTNVVGGNPPYQYAYHLGGDPNYDDDLSVYTSDTFYNVTTYGTYQVRVMDVCGVFYTESIVATPVESKVRLHPTAINNNLACEDEAYALSFEYRNPSGVTIPTASFFEGGGCNVKVYASNSSCMIGTLLMDSTYNVSSSSQLKMNLPKVESKYYYFVTTSPCGDTMAYCWNAGTSSINPSLSVVTNASGCDAASGGKMTIRVNSHSGNAFNFPVALYIVKADTDEEVAAYTGLTGSALNTILATGLDASNYKLIVVDECNDTFIRNVTNIYDESILTTATASAHNNTCIGGVANDVLGRSNVTISLGNLTPGLADAATTVVITSGPSGVGQVGTIESAGLKNYRFTNLLPGSYVATITTICGVYTKSFTVGASTGLRRAITANSYSMCTGLGGINLSVDYNGSGSGYYTLHNAITHVVLATGASGTTSFPNLTAGTYYVTMRIVNCAGDTSYTTSNPVTVLEESAPPRVTRALALVCGDDVSGTAYLTIAGSSPVKLEYKLLTESSWTLYSNDAPANVTMTDLTLGATYQVRITSCGKSKITQFKVKNLIPVTSYKTYYPCEGASFTARYPRYAGATYQWIRNTTGEVVSTSNDLLLGTFDPIAMDGAYTLTITWSGCMIRVVNVNLNSDSCGYPTGSINIAGNVFNDNNALTDGLVNGNAIGVADGTQLYVSLVSNGVVLAVTTVNADGTYLFEEQEPGVYSVVLGMYPDGSAFSELPENWVNTGEDHNGASGIDDLVDGDLEFEVLSTNITNLNFGIEALPVSQDKAEPVQLNPGGSLQVVVPILTGSDFEDGIYNGIDGTDKIQIVTLPVAGTLYYDGVVVTEGQIINNYTPALLMVDPIDGDDVTVTFTYSHIDIAELAGLPATVNMPFVLPSISGNVFNDGNGLTDGMVNGPSINNPSLTQLYASLIDSDGNLVTVTTVSNTGSYSFVHIPGNTNYKVVISISSEGSIDAGLPNNWVFVGDNIGLTPGSDGIPNGIIDVVVGLVDVNQVNFGIDHRPESVNREQHFNAEPKIGTTFNLGPVPFVGTDREDQPTEGPWSNTVKIVDLPTNGFILKYDGLEVVSGQEIVNFDIAKMTIEASEITPLGTNSSTFTYITIDQAGVEDLTPADYIVTFVTPLPVELTLFKAEGMDEICANRIYWTTAYEESFDRFELERSKDATSFEMIASIPSKGNNSAYEFLDVQAERGTTYYKLVMIDVSGKKIESKNETAILACSGKMNIIVYPTQTNGEVNIAGLTQESEISIINTLGQVVMQPVKTTEKQHVLNISNMSSGSYYVVVSVKGENYTFKIIKK